MWSEKLICLVRTLAPYKSAKKIAEDLRSRGIFVTRNAVVGICSRNGISLAKTKIEWTPDKLDIIRSLAALGITSTELSRRLYEEHSLLACPENIVLICKRNNIALSHSRGAQSLPKPIFRPKAVEQYKPNPSISLFDAHENTCREIIGDPKKFRCCPKRAVVGSYCLEHASKNYDFTKRKRS